MLGNFPQGLTHLSHISVALAEQQAAEMKLERWDDNGMETG